MKTTLPSRGLIFPKPSPSEGTVFTPYACEQLRSMVRAETVMRDILAYLVGGEHVAAALGHIAAYFGVGVPTVKVWRQQGMPGRPGSYNVVDVLVWRLERDAEGEHRRLTILCCPRCEAQRNNQSP